MQFIHNKNQITLYTPDYVTVAEVTFPSVDKNVVNIDNTYVDSVLKGKGIADKLMFEVVKNLRSTNRVAILTCAYATHWFDKHLECQDVLVSK